MCFRAAHADPVLPKAHAYIIASTDTKPAGSPELGVLPAAQIIRKVIWILAVCVDSGHFSGMLFVCTASPPPRLSLRPRANDYVCTLLPRLARETSSQCSTNRIDLFVLPRQWWRGQVQWQTVIETTPIEQLRQQNNATQWNVTDKVPNKKKKLESNKNLSPSTSGLKGISFLYS